jgi:ABC-type uncharacterized transport system substrate-binding protein
MAKKSTAKLKRRSPRAGKSATIGILHSGTEQKHDKEIAAFLKSLKGAGYTQLTIVPNGEPLWSHDDPKELADNADKLVAINGIDLVIGAGGSASALEVARATKNTGLKGVFTSYWDINSPAANMTGVCALTTSLDVTRLRFLYNQVKPPKQSTFGILENNTRDNYDPAPLKAEAKRLQIKPDPQPVFRKAGEKDQDVVKRIEDAFSGWTGNVAAVLVAADPIFNDHRKEVLGAAKKAGIPVMYQWSEFKNEGGYASYGTSLIDAYDAAGTIAGQVLDNTDPKDIPICVLTPAPAINRKTAKRLKLLPKAR